MDFSRLTPAQLDIVKTLDEPLFVAAGAGSGKTQTLTQRIVWALLPGSLDADHPFLDSIDQALIITFTHAAADEIKERVRRALRSEGLEDQALQVDSAWISTIHGMCARILHAHALDLGIDPAFKMMSELETEEQRKLALEQALREVSSDPQYKKLFKDHPVDDKSKGMSVEAMVSRLVDASAAAPLGDKSLVWPGQAADWSSIAQDVLSACETLAAVGNDSHPENAEDVEACAAYIREALSRCAPSSRDITWFADIEEHLVKLDGRNWRKKEVKPFYEELKKEIQIAKATLIANQEAELREPLLKLVEMVRSRYNAYKHAHGKLDNDDLLLKCTAAFETHPEIAAEYATKFRLVMVDEFQDTSEQQVKMITKLAGPDAIHLTTVGDAQQSIYRFRGADVGVFINRQALYDDVHSPKMAKNFRSHDDILRLVAKVCSATDLIPNFMDLEHGRDESRVKLAPIYEAAHMPRVCIEVTLDNKHGNLSAGSDQRSKTAAAQIADRLYQLSQDGVPLSQMYLLLGKMKNAVTYLNALRSRGLTCVVTGGSSFHSLEEVGVVCDLVQTLANPHNSQALFSVLTSSMFMLEASDLLLLGTTISKSGIVMRERIENALRFQTFAQGHIPSQRLQLAIDVMGSAWDSVGTKSPADIVMEVVDKSGWLQRCQEDGPQGRAVAANLLAAVRYLRDLCEEVHLGVAQAAREFAAWLDVAKASPATLVSEESEAIQIMTVHASKGLQAGVVAVAECLGDPAFPPSKTGCLSVVEKDKVICSIARSNEGALKALGEDLPLEAKDCKTLLDWRAYLEYLESQQSSAEQGRLLYVALTRAEDMLILSLPVVKSNPKNKPSTLAPAMANSVVQALFDGVIPEPGQSEFDYGGSKPALIRCVKLDQEESKDKSAPKVETGKTFDQSWIEAQPISEKPSEKLYPQDLTLSDALQNPEFYGIRQGVYSYTMAKREGINVGAMEPVSEKVMCTQDNTDTSDIFTANKSSEVGTSTKQDNPDDLDERATALGSAFHSLAQYMAETGLRPSHERIQAQARLWGCTKAQVKRLHAALNLWEHSHIRQEALSYSHVQAEVPFFEERPTQIGDYMQGAIDLLCWNSKEKAFIIDYKTGDATKSFDQLVESHREQASLYAEVAKTEGFSKVSCAFVCVERNDGHDEPLVVRYEFDDME